MEFWNLVAPKDFKEKGEKKENKDPRELFGKHQCAVERKMMVQGFGQRCELVSNPAQGGTEDGLGPEEHPNTSCENQSELQRLEGALGNTQELRRRHKPRDCSSRGFLPRGSVMQS